MLLSADYNGGLALASLFHLAPAEVFLKVEDEYEFYMSGENRLLNGASKRF